MCNDRIKAINKMMPYIKKKKKKKNSGTVAFGAYLVVRNFARIIVKKIFTGSFVAPSCKLPIHAGFYIALQFSALMCSSLQ